MISIKAFRKRAVDRLQHMLTRPGMYGTRDGLEVLFQNQLYDLALIDERTAEYSERIEDLKERGFYCNTGFSGKLELTFPNCGACSDELASLFAEIAAHLGWLPFERLLSEHEWNDLRQFARRKRHNKDYRQSEIVARFGTPSHAVGAGHSHCYVSDDPVEHWICFDYSNEYRTWQDRNGVHSEWVYGDDPILRNVRWMRHNDPSFTPYGRKITGARIRKTKGVCGGDACIRETRIPVWTLIAMTRLGRSEAKILRDYPTLTYDDLCAAWDYYRRHAKEIHEVIVAEETAE